MTLSRRAFTLLSVVAALLPAAWLGSRPLRLKDGWILRGDD